MPTAPWAQDTEARSFHQLPEVGIESALLAASRFLWAEADDVLPLTIFLYRVNWLLSSRTNRKGRHDVAAFPNWWKCPNVPGPRENHSAGISKLKSCAVDHVTGLDPAGRCFVDEEHIVPRRYHNSWLFPLIRGVWLSGRQAVKANSGDNVPLEEHSRAPSRARR